MPAASPTPERGAAAQSWRRALELTAPIAQQPEVTFPFVINRLAEQFGDAPALLSERETLSYAALAQRAGQYAAWAVEQRLGSGEVVCLLMPNCPEYLAIWLGIVRAGGVVALINTNLLGDGLRHAIAIVQPRHVIVASEHIGALAAVLPQLGPLRAWAHGGDAPGWPRIDRALPTDGRPGDAKPPTLADRALYIYTSGTTGLPKAASVSHRRVMEWTHWFAGLIGATPADRMYNCLPMYHSVGGVVATGAVLIGGGSVAIRERFSASRFWDDVDRWDCTLFQYIGELCRYLLNAPPHPRETGHRLRLACGNGLREDVWDAFQNRFHIPRIIEFYAATEASFSLYNCDGKQGSIGRMPSYLAHRFPVAIIKFDVDAGEILRGADGFCLKCGPDEVGEAIGRLPGKDTGAGGSFEGYTDPAASEAKILRDVFAPGDAWYRTGDLMRRDRAGYFYFADRIGDTFRWKGENVSTTEVEAAIAAYPGVNDAVVYGVSVPGADGRAGMAALVTDSHFDLTGVTAFLTERLPEYARPVFLRLCPQIATTGTFKPQKQALAAEGFSPAAIGDPLYLYDCSQGCFVTLDSDLFRRIQCGALRL
ncbi:MAG TPA: long-chain-acyl-CoA synthetase [Stellaceae bacterium]|nr:long-chain-acyl-CoA synthetase [Stellaceae bacterium]